MKPFGLDVATRQAERLGLPPARYEGLVGFATDRDGGLRLYRRGRWGRRVVAYHPPGEWVGLLRRDP